MYGETARTPHPEGAYSRLIRAAYRARAIAQCPTALWLTCRQSSRERDKCREEMNFRLLSGVVAALFSTASWVDVNECLPGLIANVTVQSSSKKVAQSILKIIDEKTYEGAPPEDDYQPQRH